MAIVEVAFELLPVISERCGLYMPRTAVRCDCSALIVFMTDPSSGCGARWGIVLSAMRISTPG